MDGLGALVAQLLPLGGQGIALLPEVSIFNEALVVEPLEGMGLLVQVRQGRVQFVELGVALLLPGGDLFQNLNFLSFLTLNANCSHHLSPSGSS